jgi:dihydroorotase-like cyclic amidohydrolase
MKPMIAAGSLADLVIFDPESSWTVASDWRSRGVCDPLKGSTLSGQVRATIVGGSPIFEC